jgi:hypothetical protein
MEEFEKDALCAEALRLWGGNAQALMVIEEAAELILGVCKFYRNQATARDLANEIADNRVMARQLMLMVGIPEETVTNYQEYKWKRLRERVDKSKEEKHNRGKD